MLTQVLLGLCPVAHVDDAGRSGGWLAGAQLHGVLQDNVIILILLVLVDLIFDGVRDAGQNLQRSCLLPLLLRRSLALLLLQFALRAAGDLGGAALFLTRALVRRVL